MIDVLDTNTLIHFFQGQGNVAATLPNVPHEDGLTPGKPRDWPCIGTNFRSRTSGDALHTLYIQVIAKESAHPSLPWGRNGRGPRERLLEDGPHVLSDQELLAVVLGSGHAGCNVNTLAGQVLRVLEEASFEIRPGDLMQVSGMGPAKATQLAAAIEFCRRVLAPRNYRIRQPSDAVPLLQHYADRKQEHFIAVSLNGAHEVHAVRICSVGLVNRTLVSSLFIVHIVYRILIRPAASKLDLPPSESLGCRDLAVR